MGLVRCGLQIANFTFPDVGPLDLFERVASVAATAEQSGFDSVVVMDHFYPLPPATPEGEMLEAYTLLGALAARTSSANLGALVSGVTHRNPAILAKAVTSLDVISKGRAILGLGAAWYEFEHDALGIPFPPLRERFERLEEAIQICRGMLTSQRPTHDGRHYRVLDAINSPSPISAGGPPILIGGSGEKVTLRLVATYADIANITDGLIDLPRKLEVLEEHCRDIGRDVATITKTGLGQLFLGRTHAEGVAKAEQRLAALGTDWDGLDPRARSRMFVGDANDVGEQIGQFLAAGLDGMYFNMFSDGHDLDAVAFAGEVVSAALAAHVGGMSPTEPAP